LWQAFEQSGFLNALLSESNGGAGLALRDVFPLIELCGRYAVPVPFAQTMIVRAALVNAGLDIPEGPVALADGFSATNVVSALTADWLLATEGDRARLSPLKLDDVDATGSYEHLTGNVPTPGDGPTFDVAGEWRAAGAAILAAQMSGAMARVMDFTVTFANDRSQFGRAIGKFQAIQQQLSIMAEQTFAAKMAAEIGCQSDGFMPDPALAAVAKSRTSEAATTICTIAHSVHGAIGATEELDLQLFTRRIHEWRTAFGSESYWNQQIGEALLASDSNRILDDVRLYLSP